MQQGQNPHQERFCMKFYNEMKQLYLETEVSGVAPVMGLL